jgi:hypothetical protein
MVKGPAWVPVSVTATALVLVMVLDLAWAKELAGGWAPDLVMEMALVSVSVWVTALESEYSKVLALVKEWAMVLVTEKVMALVLVSAPVPHKIRRIRSRRHIPFSYMQAGRHGIRRNRKCPHNNTSELAVHLDQHCNRLLFRIFGPPH